LGHFLSSENINHLIVLVFENIKSIREQYNSIDNFLNCFYLKSIKKQGTVITINLSSKNNGDNSVKDESYLGSFWLVCKQNIMDVTIYGNNSEIYIEISIIKGNIKKINFKKCDIKT